jgi:3-hydroxyisobutyrate dehydrogenase-like beta-hydroxyacid dehydrogenase
MSRIAFLGLGAMGSRMAASLVAKDHDVTVWNRDPAKTAPLRDAGATVALTPRAAAADAEVVIAMVRDDGASRQVWLDDATGALDAVRPDAIAVECSTLGLEWTRALAQRFAARGRSFLDAPVVGSRPHAEQRQLVFVVGGTRDSFARAEPLLSCMGSAAHHAGPNGAGMLAKLLVNALFAVQVAALAELIGAVRRTGLDAARIAEVVCATPACSMAAAGAARSMLADAFAPMFPVALAAKDLGYALAAGGPADVAPMVAAARAVFAAGIAAGWGEENLTSIAKLYRP